MAMQRQDETVGRENATQLLASSSLRRLTVVRHGVESTAARIATECERMLRAVADPERREWRNAIGEALLTSRHLQSIAQSPIARSDLELSAQLGELETAAAADLARVADLMSVITRVVPQAIEDELLVEDARTVQQLAMARAGTATSVPPDDRDSSPSADASLAHATAARPEASHLLRRATMLVVDDDDGIRRMLQLMLERMHYDVVLAANGREGLDTALARPIDLVLTDINMPAMHGLSLLREIKTAPGLKHIPVVMISGEDDSAKVIQSLELGADDYVSKPFDPTLLQARIRSSLSRKRMRDLELDHLNRVGQIAAAAQAVDKHVYVAGALDAVARGRDQIAQLARVFERMALNQRSREERLAHRLRSLRREMGGFSSSQPTSASRSDVSPFANGDLVADRYMIVGSVGRGGMGMVYHATDAELGEEIALKVVRPDAIKEDPNLASRLRSEIRLARKLAHANVVRSYDLGCWRGTYFVTMEYVRGVSLSASLDERGRFSSDAVIAIGIQLADALAVAHAQHIIHRDIKPGNLMMDVNGRLKVMDFGLAKTVGAEHGDTLTGHVIGTPAYMAPEQLTAGALDGRTDLYAAGVVLYECLTGKPPFDDEEPAKMLNQMVLGTYAPLTHSVPEIPPALDAIVRQLLRLEPAQRIQSAADLSRRLSEIETTAAA